MRRYELTDDQWLRIEEMFPANKGKRGGQWQDPSQGDKRNDIDLM
jgi:transposase